MAGRNEILRQRFSLLYPTFKNIFKKFKLVKRNNTLINTKNNKEQHYPKYLCKTSSEIKPFSCSCYDNYFLATPMTILNSHHNRSTFSLKMSIKIYIENNGEYKN